MAGDVNRVAREWAKAAMADAVIAATLRKNHRALILQSMSPGGLNTITQATKNGVNIGKSMGLSVQDTMTAFGKAIEWVELGAIPCQSRAYGRF